MAKAKAQPSKEEIAAKKAALKEAIKNLKEAVKGLKGYVFDLEGIDTGKGILMVLDPSDPDLETVVAQISVKAR